MGIAIGVVVHTIAIHHSSLRPPCLDRKDPSTYCSYRTLDSAYPHPVHPLYMGLSDYGFCDADHLVVCVYYTGVCALLSAGGCLWLAKKTLSWLDTVINIFLFLLALRSPPQVDGVGYLEYFTVTCILNFKTEMLTGRQV